MIYLFIMLIIFASVLSWIIANLSKNTKTFLLKGGLITLMLYMSLCIFFSFESVKGWPTAAQLPETFELQAFVIEEPSKIHKTSGAIYLWLIPRTNTNSCPPGLICVRSNSAGTPRAYMLPYTQAMHEQMLEIEGTLKDGGTIIVENKKKKQKDGNGGGQSPEAEELEFYDLPDFMEELRKD